MLAIIPGFGGDDDWDAGITTTDAEVGILHHDGKSFTGGVPEFGFLSEASDGTEGLELGKKALFDSVDFSEVVERFVGQFGVGCLLQNGEENLAGFLVVVLSDRKDAAEEVGTDGDGRIWVFREVGEYFRSLVVDALRHVGFTNSKARVDGFRLVLVDV